jgi:hypothetical protein
MEKGFFSFQFTFYENYILFFIQLNKPSSWTKLMVATEVRRRPKWNGAPMKRAVVIWRTVDVSNHKKFILSLF